MKNKKSSLIQTILERKLQNWEQRPWKKNQNKEKTFTCSL